MANSFAFFVLLLKLILKIVSYNSIPNAVFVQIAIESVFKLDYNVFEVPFCFENIFIKEYISLIKILFAVAQSVFQSVLMLFTIVSRRTRAW